MNVKVTITDPDAWIQRQTQDVSEVWAPAGGQGPGVDILEGTLFLMSRSAFPSFSRKHEVSLVCTRVKCRAEFFDQGPWGAPLPCMFSVFNCPNTTDSNESLTVRSV